jgi:hypothetical protein|tara:strand:+ start:2698 stop:2949 length:252 start_codon:yes stop_codon:yes gene_type:complete
MRINTIEVVRELVEKLGGGYRPCARILGTSHTALWHALEGDRPPPTLDTLARWASNAKEEAGIELSFTVKPGGVLDWTFTLSE